MSRFRFSRRRIPILISGFGLMGAWAYTAEYQQAEAPVGPAQIPWVDPDAVKPNVSEAPPLPTEVSSDGKSLPQPLSLQSETDSNLQLPMPVVVPEKSSRMPVTQDFANDKTSRMPVIRGKWINPLNPAESPAIAAAENRSGPIPLLLWNPPAAASSATLPPVLLSPPK